MSRKRMFTIVILWRLGVGRIRFVSVDGRWDVMKNAEVCIDTRT